MIGWQGGGVGDRLGQSLVGGLGRVVMGDLGVRGSRMERRMLMGGMLVWAMLVSG